MKMVDESKAKLSALKDIRKQLSDVMSGDLGDKMQKVTVAAKDKEGLKAGLEKAEELMDQVDVGYGESDKQEDREENSEMMRDSYETAANEQYEKGKDLKDGYGDGDDMSLEEIDELMEMLKSKRSKYE